MKLLPFSALLVLVVVLNSTPDLLFLTLTSCLVCGKYSKGMFSRTADSRLLFGATVTVKSLPVSSGVKSPAVISAGLRMCEHLAFNATSSRPQQR